MTSWVRRKLGELEGVKKARLLSTVATIAVLVATLWPLSPFPKNRVTWLPGTNGLKFERPGLVVGTRPMTPQQSGSSQSRTIELMLRPAGIKSSGTILAFYSSSHPRQSLRVRQWRDGLLVTHDARVESDRREPLNLMLITFFIAGSSCFSPFLPGRMEHRSMSMVNSPSLSQHSTSPAAICMARSFLGSHRRVTSRGKVR